MADPTGGAINNTALVWWDADTSTKTVSGTDCSQLNDKSGNALHYVASGTGRPQSGTRTVNTHNVLDFNGSTHFMTTAVATDYFLRPVTVCLAFVADVLLNDDQYVLWNGVSGSTQEWLLALSDDATDMVGVLWGGVANINNYPGPPTIPVATVGYIIATIDIDGNATSEIRYNKVSHITGDIGPSDGGPGTLLSLGRFPSSANHYFNGAFLECVIYDGLLTSPTERDLIEAYFDTHWINTPGATGAPGTDILTVTSQAPKGGVAASPPTKVATITSNAPTGVATGGGSATGQPTTKVATVTSNAPKGGASGTPATHSHQITVNEAAAGPPPPPAWTPASLSAAAWLIADRDVTANGAHEVTALLDQTLNNNDMPDSGNLQRPKNNVLAVNGRQAIVFSAGTFLERLGVVIPQPYTVFMALVMRDLSDFRTTFAGDDPIVASNYVARYAGGHWRADAGISVDPGFGPTVDVLHSITQVCNGAFSSIQMDATASGTINIGTNSINMLHFGMNDGGDGNGVALCEFVIVAGDQSAYIAEWNAYIDSEWRGVALPTHGAQAHLGLTASVVGVASWTPVGATGSQAHDIAIAARVVGSRTETPIGEVIGYLGLTASVVGTKTEDVHGVQAFIGLTASVVGTRTQGAVDAPPEPIHPVIFSPSPDVRFAIADVVGGFIRTLDIALDGHNYTETLCRPGAFTARLPLHSPFATEEILDPWRTAIYAIRGDKIEWGGILLPPSMQVGSDVLDISAFGWSGYWDHRTNRTDYTPVQVDQFDIVAQLITNAQDEVVYGTGWNLDIAVVWDALSGVLRDRVDDYRPWKAKNLGEALRQLAADDNGFDFAMEYTLNTTTDRIDKVLRLYFPRKGRVTNFVFEYEAGRSDTNVTGRGFADVTDLAWAGDGWGSGTDALRLQSPYIDESLRGVYPPYDAAPAWSDVTVQATLDEHTLGVFGRMNRPHRVPVLRLHPERYPQWGDYQLGDVVGVRINDGYGSTDGAEQHRITGTRVTDTTMEIILDVEPT